MFLINKRMSKIFIIPIICIAIIFPFSITNAQEPDSKNIKTDTAIAPAKGTLADCKNILSDGCRSYLLQLNASKILGQLRDAFIFEGNQLVCNQFRAKLEKSTKNILEVEFKGFDKNPYGKPAENLKWGATMKSVKKLYGEPLEIRTETGSVNYLYKNFELLFPKSKNYSLRIITLKNYISKDEIAATEKLKAIPPTTQPITTTAPVTTVAKAKTVAKAPDKNMELILDEMKKAFTQNGGKLIASGSTNFNLVREDALYRYTEKNDVYVFAAVSDYDPLLSVSHDTYPHDEAKRTSDDYKSTYDKSRNGNYSVIFMTLNIMPFSQISSLQFKPTGTGDVHWLLFRKR